MFLDLPAEQTASGVEVVGLLALATIRGVPVVGHVSAPVCTSGGTRSRSFAKHGTNRAYQCLGVTAVSLRWRQPPNMMGIDVRTCRDLTTAEAAITTNATTITTSSPATASA